MISPSLSRMTLAPFQPSTHFQTPTGYPITACMNWAMSYPESFTTWQLLILTPRSSLPKLTSKMVTGACESATMGNGISPTPFQNSPPRMSSSSSSAWPWPWAGLTALPSSVQLRKQPGTSCRTMQPSPKFHHTHLNITCSTSTPPMQPSYTALPSSLQEPLCPHHHQHQKKSTLMTSSPCAKHTLFPTSNTTAEQCCTRFMTSFHPPLSLEAPSRIPSLSANSEVRDPGV